MRILGAAAAVELEGVVEQVLEEQLELGLVAAHHRQRRRARSGRPRRAFGLQPGGDARHQRLEIHLGEALVAALDPRQPQHGVHHLLEAGGAGARLVEQPGALLAGAPGGLLGEQVEKANDLGERLAKVVRHGVSHLLELRLRPRQRGGALGESRLDGASRRSAT